MPKLNRILQKQSEWFRRMYLLNTFIISEKYSHYVNVMINITRFRKKYKHTFCIAKDLSYLTRINSLIIRALEAGLVDGWRDCYAAR